MYIGFNSYNRIDFLFVRSDIFYFVTMTNILYARAFNSGALMTIKFVQQSSMEVRDLSEILIFDRNVLSESR